MPQSNTADQPITPRVRDKQNLLPSDKKKTMKVKQPHLFYTAR